MNMTTQPQNNEEVNRSGSQTHLLERRHPGRRQMAVLQHHPRAFLHALLDHLERDRALTLTQRQAVELSAAETL